MFLLDAPRQGEAILFLLVREPPIRTLKTFIFGEKGGVHSTVLFRSVFEANAWGKVPIPLLYALQLPSPLHPAFRVLHTLIVITLIQLMKADCVELKSISTAECVIWINSLCG